MDAALLFPNKYLKAVEFKGREATLTISNVALEELAQEGGETKSKGVVSFVESKKAWVLNRTNASCLISMFGRETDNWLGKRVTLYPMPFRDPFTGEATVAIRVRGSPDLAKDMPVEIQLPRKKPMRVTLKKTAAKQRSNGSKPAAVQAPVAAPAPPPPPEPEPGEDFDPLTGEVWNPDTKVFEPAAAE